MAIPFQDLAHDKSDPRALPILAKTIHRELRANGYEEGDIMRLASELLGIVTHELKSRNRG
jgi:hypothetical protein